MINFDLNEEDYLKLESLVLNYCQKNQLDEDQHLDLMEDFLSEPRESEKSSLFIWQVLHDDDLNILDSSNSLQKIREMAKDQYKKITTGSIYH